MSQVIRTCSKVASLVGELCRALPGDPLAAVEVVDPASVPQPYRRLLVHDSDMTSTLEDHYGEPIMLKVLNRVATPRWLARRRAIGGPRWGNRESPFARRQARFATGILRRSASAACNSR